MADRIREQQRSLDHMGMEATPPILYSSLVVCRGLSFGHWTRDTFQPHCGHVRGSVIGGSEGRTGSLCSSDRLLHMETGWRGVPLRQWFFFVDFVIDDLQSLAVVLLH